MSSPTYLRLSVGVILGLHFLSGSLWALQSAAHPRQNSRINAANSNHQKNEGRSLKRDIGTPPNTQAAQSLGVTNRPSNPPVPTTTSSAATAPNSSGRKSGKLVPATSAGFSRNLALDTSTASPPEVASEHPINEPLGTATESEREAEEADGEDDEDTAWRLFDGPILKRHQIEVNGWWSNGYTWNPARPTNRLNGPNGVNDRANDFMFHQLGLSLERSIDPSEAQYQWGGRIDLMYGADARLVQSAGFDDTWHSGRFVALAIPQVYAEWFDPNLNPWGQGVTFRVGRFWSPIGYEGVPSRDRFFFSATNAFMLAQPATHTGVMATADVGSNWTAQLGLVRGWDVTTDNNKSPGYLGTLGWVSDDAATSVTHVLYHGDETDDLSDAQTTYELIVTRQLTEKWTYVGWFDFNFAQRIASNSVGDPKNAQWFSLNQAFLHAVTDKTSWGVRGEWFHDNDGTRITDPESGDPLGRGNLFGLTFGINHTPTMNLLIRPELRWDWSSGGLPFDDQTSSRQATAGLDVVLSF